MGNVALPAHQRTITIRLDGCSTPGANSQPTTATVRFDGPIRNGRINTSNATADIQLLENNSTTAIWDLSGPSAPVNLQSGTNTLNYIARYYVAAVPLAPGEANAEATFTMNYQ
ncbi:hypothetical protein HQS1_06920 [Delftia lacustris]|nr:hypothetical protein HQS1_06920 [Delftia lacustris]